MPKPTHGGKRQGAGRKPAPFPAFSKKLRAAEEERKEFMGLLTGDARKDFVTVLNALKLWKRSNDGPGGIPREAWDQLRRMNEERDKK